MRRVVLGALVVTGVAVLLALVGVAAFYAVFYFPGGTSATARTIVSSGRTREYLLHVPRGYDGARPTPLVISLHGAMLWPGSQMHISRWNRVADEHGFLVAYPAGTGAGPRAWFMEGRATPSRMPDVVFVSQLIDALEASYNIDPARIYADGFSNGGGMAFALSCTLADRIAAVGMVSAARSLDWTWCPAHRPVPSIAFHGTADPLVPFDGGRTPAGPDVFPSVRSFTATWARRNGCAPRPVATTFARGVERLEYGSCRGDADVVLFTLEGGGHQWPGGERLPEFLLGPYRRDVDATSEMWAFFREHPLRAGE